MAQLLYFKSTGKFLVPGRFANVQESVRRLLKLDCKRLEVVMYRSIRNSHIPPPPPPRAYPGPQGTWGGAFDHNTRGVGNLIRCLDFMFRAALRIKTARVCLQTLKQMCEFQIDRYISIRYRIDFWGACHGVEILDRTNTFLFEIANDTSCWGEL